jgi:2',3'-cyclic-nucleotide 2'-phosphodiesterase (5'-nucleotidase family)
MRADHRGPLSPAIVHRVAMPVLSLLLGIGGFTGSARGVATAPRTFQVLAVNDIYRIEGVDEQTAGGMARLRSLRKQLDRPNDPVLVLHAGDFLFPSSLSRQYQGAQMIAAMNMLDGARGSFDQHLFVTFGNHEFDKRGMAFAPTLQSRIRESEFYWLGSNIDFVPDASGQPSVAAPNLLRQRIVEIYGVKVGLFSLSTDMAVPEYASISPSYVELAHQHTSDLRQAGADVVIGLTHLRISEDFEILDKLGADGPDVIFGGHEHNRQHRCTDDGRCAIKADADVRSATVAKVSLGPDGKVDIGYRYVLLEDSTIAEDREVEAEVEQWMERYEVDFCSGQGQPSGCLQTPLGRTNVELVGEELEIRRYETNLGGWIVEQALAAFADVSVDGAKAQVAFLNSGSLRLNQNIPAGTQLTQWHMSEIFQYPVTLKLIEISGATLQQVINHAVEDWTGNGWWLQIAGFVFRHDTENGKATDLRLIGDDGRLRQVDPNERILAVVGDYLVSPDTDHDGYDMLRAEDVVSDSEFDLKKQVIAAIEAAGDRGISPALAGRICSSDRPSAPCLLE